MRTRSFISKYKTKASAALVLRAAIVGANFVVMIGLAAILGIGPFGALVYLWSIALLGSTVLSVGGPMILLRNLTDGHGMSRGHVLICSLVLPMALAGMAYPILLFLWPGFAWGPVLCAGFAVNLSACVASLLRARGSLMTSMALRDAGPFVALGCGALMWGGVAPEAGLFAASIILSGFAGLALVWAQSVSAAPIVRTRTQTYGGQLSLWGASVIGVAIAQMDLILGGAVLGAEALGIYALLRRIANVVALPVSVATWISAPQVSAAFGARDWAGLRKASAAGSRIAWYPALALCGVGLIGAGLSNAAPFIPLPAPMTLVFAVLLLGALLQAYWASGYTVATLTDAPALSLAARAIVLGCYFGLATWQGAVLTPLSNAIAYVVAMSLGSLFLWHALRRRFGVDTSAAALWDKGGMSWTTS